MKWIFMKENEECKIRLRETDGTEVDFSYVEMIKVLYEEKKIEVAEFQGDFSEKERESVNLLIDEINKHAEAFFKQDIEECEIQ